VPLHRIVGSRPRTQDAQCSFSFTLIKFHPVDLLCFHLLLKPGDHAIHSFLDGPDIGIILLGSTTRGIVPVQSPGPFPAARVDGQDRGGPGCQVNESTVIADLAVPKQPGQQGQGVLREDGVDKGGLSLQGFNGATARFRVVVETGIDNLRVDLGRRSQPQPGPAVPLVERLTQDELPAVQRVPGVQPIGS